MQAVQLNKSKERKKKKRQCCMFFQPSCLGRRVGVLSAVSAVEVLAGRGESRKELVVFSIMQALWEEKGIIIGVLGCHIKALNLIWALSGRNMYN